MLNSICYRVGFPGGSEAKASACNAGDLGSIPGSGRSSGEGNGNPLQYSCLENPMDRGAWWATVHGVAKSQTRLSDFTSLHFKHSISDSCSLPCCYYCYQYLLRGVSISTKYSGFIHHGFKTSWLCLSINKLAIIFYVLWCISLHLLHYKHPE